MYKYSIYQIDKCNSLSILRAPQYQNCANRKMAQTFDSLMDIFRNMSRKKSKKNQSTPIYSPPSSSRTSSNSEQEEGINSYHCKFCLPTCKFHLLYTPSSNNNWYMSLINQIPMINVNIWIVYVEYFIFNISNPKHTTCCKSDPELQDTLLIKYVLAWY